MSYLFYGDIGHEPPLEPRDEPTPDCCPNCGAKMKGAEDGTTYAE